MKSLINGFGGGFGRVFGRIVAYIIIGFLIYLLLAVFGINIKSIIPINISKINIGGLL